MASSVNRWEDAQDDLTADHATYLAGLAEGILDAMLSDLKEDGEVSAELKKHIIEGKNAFEAEVGRVFDTFAARSDEEQEAHDSVAEASRTGLEAMIAEMTDGLNAAIDEAIDWIDSAIDEAKEGVDQALGAAAGAVGAFQAGRLAEWRKEKRGALR